MAARIDDVVPPRQTGIMDRRATKWAMALAKLVVLGAIVWIVWRHVEWGKLWLTLRGVRPAFFALSLACLFVVPVVLALRLSYVSKLPLRPLILCVVKSCFFNSLFVAQVGGDVYKIYFLSGVVRDRKRAIAFVAGDRVIGITGLVGLSLLNVTVGGRYFRDPRIHISVVLYLSALVMIFATIFLVPDNWLRGFDRYPRIGSLLAKIRRTRAYAREALTRKLLVGVALTLASYFLLIVGNVLAMLAMRLRVDMVASALYVPVISVAAVTLPISFNGLGVRESLFILFFGLAGYTAEEGLALGMVGLVGMTVVAIGGGVLVVVTGGRRALRGSNAAPRPQDGQLGRAQRSSDARGESAGPGDP